MLQKFAKTTKKGFTLVELMIVVAIIGILAALAIPAFIKYIKSSKAAEAAGIVGSLTAGGKSYFEGDQQYANATGGDQPWHVATGIGQLIVGFPVPFGTKTFPGGLTAVVLTHATSPQGGGKLTPLMTGPATLEAITNKLNWEVNDPTYFGYRYATGGTPGATATMTSSACHKFTGGSGFNMTSCTIAGNTTAHSFIQSCGANAQDAVQCGPGYVINEFK